MAGSYVEFDQQLARPLAEPEHPVVAFGVTTGEPEIFGTCGRDAALGLDGLTAPGIARWLADGLPVVPGGLEGGGVMPGAFVWALAAATRAMLAAPKSRARRAVFHMVLAFCR